MLAELPFQLGDAVIDAGLLPGTPDRECRAKYGGKGAAWCGKLQEVVLHRDIRSFRGRNGAVGRAQRQHAAWQSMPLST